MLSGFPASTGIEGKTERMVYEKLSTGDEKGSETEDRAR